MGLRCLIGHDFGAVLTDRDRRERGDEVVVTVREYRECDRCGEVRVVSENKEVRHVGSGAEAESADEMAGADSGREELDDVAAEDDDGVILEDEPTERDRGAWPEEDATDEPAEDSSEPAPWPEVEGEDEGYGAEPSDGAPLEGVEFRSGLTPEATPSDPSAAASGEEGDVVEGSGGIRRAAPGPSPTGRQRSEAPETEFHCPECDFAAPTEDSSLRPGDICPNCRLGYLTERSSS